MAKALFAKLWWNFRTSTSSLWSEFMWNKYCKKFHPIMAKGYGVSHVWRKMMTVKDEVEHNIWWQVKAGNSSFWFDNWTQQGALYYVDGENAIEKELKVQELIRGGEWDIQGLRSKLSEEMTTHVVKT
uniref:RNase H family protein n=1 Tax=Solanum tuberosum TaxID=4113 RepID=M0ZQV0_SOLTU